MIPYAISRDENGRRTVSAFIAGRGPQIANESHANFHQITEALEAQEQGDPWTYADPDHVVDLFDAAAAVASRFRRLSDRVTVADGVVYFDGDPVATPLTRQILRFVQEDVPDWQPLVAFFEKVQQNPSDHSREQLFVWLDQHRFSLTTDGDIICYKGVTRTPTEDGGYDYRSVHSGPAIVDGVAVNGRVPNHPGAVVEMPRSKVQFNPAVGCSTGLHVATHQFASGWGTVVMEAHVNPRDVVSVPTECDAQKMRVSRYRVIREVASEYQEALVA